MELSRGDVVLCAAPGDYGKPRPAVVVQSDLFNETHDSIVVCPLTSHLVEAPLFRLQIVPTKGNGLRKDSQLMVDKIQALRRDRVTRRIGALLPEDRPRIDEAMRLWLSL